MKYKCIVDGCGEMFPTLLLGKIHVYTEHHKSWKKARCYLRIVQPHESLPRPIEPWEFKNEPKERFFKRSEADQIRTIRKMKAVGDGSI